MTSVSGTVIVMPTLCFLLLCVVYVVSVGFLLWIVYDLLLRKP